MSKKHPIEMKRDPKSGIYVPKEVATEIGFGCPKCDDAELVPVNQIGHSIPEIITKFRKKHEGCGILHTLEKRGGRVYATAEVSSKAALVIR